jgi:hypothetical protein
MRGLPCWISIATLLLLSGCSDSRAGGRQGQTHWLQACETDPECGELQCICGVCIAACEPDGACEAAGRETECQPREGTAASALCAGEAPEPICLEPCADGCDDGQRCVGGACIAAPRASGHSGAGGSSGTDGGAGTTDGGGAAGRAGAGSGGTLDGGACRIGGDDCAPVDGGGGSGDAASDAGAAQVDCAQRPALFPAFDRSCTNADECSLATRQIDCCGTLMITGVRASEVDAYEQAAATCASQYAACECATRATQADDGTTADATGLPATVQCVDDQCRTTFGDGSATTPCGPDLECDTAAEVCVSNVPLGEIIYACRPVPGGCQDNRSCACTGDTLCQTPFTACSDQGANAIGCSCLTCL